MKISPPALIPLVFLEPSLLLWPRECHLVYKKDSQKAASSSTSVIMSVKLPSGRPGAGCLASSGPIGSFSLGRSPWPCHWGLTACAGTALLLVPAESLRFQFPPLLRFTCPFSPAHNFSLQLPQEHSFLS